jgi:class III poly(R)-hydroxyalkanoic acid synthase PhaE subunit
MSDPVNAWLAAQRDMMERWLAAPSGNATSAANGSPNEAPNALHREMERWWQAIAQDASPQAQALAQQLAHLGPGFLAGAGDALFDLLGIGPGGQAGDAAGRLLDSAPVGYFREHQAHAQALARALGDYGRIAAQMASAIARVHTDALELLAKKTEALAAANDPVTDTRRLYGLWIEAGEQAFAQHARGEIFGRLQGELVNAGVQVRIAQQTIAEYFLKSLDLPTRAELNSVHKRLKDMRERIEQLEVTTQRAGRAAGK